MKYLFFLLISAFLNAQEMQKKWTIEIGGFQTFARQKQSNQPGVLLGIWYNYPIEENLRLELGGNFRLSSSNFNLKYKKLSKTFDIETKEYVLNLGGRMIKEFKIKNQKTEWISELSFNNIFFGGKDIPDNQLNETIDNQVFILSNFDSENLSTFQFGQGLRIWEGNIGFGIKANLTPYGLLYKNTIQNQFNVFSVEATISIKL